MFKLFKNKQKNIIVIEKHKKYDFEDEVNKRLKDGYKLESSGVNNRDYPYWAIMSKEVD